MIFRCHDPRVSHVLEIQAELIEKHLTQNAGTPYRVLVAVAPADHPTDVSVVTNVYDAEILDRLVYGTRRELGDV